MKEFQQFKENQPVGPKSSIAAEAAKATETDANSIQHLISQGTAQGFQMLLPAIAKLGQSSPPEKPASRARSSSRKRASKGQGGRARSASGPTKSGSGRSSSRTAPTTRTEPSSSVQGFAKKVSIQKPPDKDPDGVKDEYDEDEEEESWDEDDDYYEEEEEEEEAFADDDTVEPPERVIETTESII